MLSVTVLQVRYRIFHQIFQHLKKTSNHPSSLQERENINMGGEYNVLLQIQLNAELALGVESQNSDGEGHDRKFLYTTA